MLEEKNDMLNGLHEGVCVVEFTKKNGDPRTMVCTLNEDLISKASDPPESLFAEGSSRSQHDGVCNVWDLEKHGWRAFRIDRVSNFTPRGNPDHLGLNPSTINWNSWKRDDQLLESCSCPAK
jgi:hypothetical protein